MEAKWYKTDGTVENVTPANGADFTLDELHEFCRSGRDGDVMVEIGYLDDNRIMVINEEGKLKGLDLNNQATEIYQAEIYPGDYIVGDVLICDADMVK